MGEMKFNYLNQNVKIKFDNVIESIPLNLMLITLDNKIAYINKETYQSLEVVGNELPASFDRLKGKSATWIYDLMREGIRSIESLKDFPCKEIIVIGENEFELTIAKLYEKKEKHVGFIFSWPLSNSNRKNNLLRINKNETIHDSIILLSSFFYKMKNILFNKNDKTNREGEEENGIVEFNDFNFRTKEKIKEK